MNKINFFKQLAAGEDSTRQFKVNIKSGDSLAAEMVAFSNSNGGTIFIGVDDDGNAVGLSIQDVKRINQLISNTASILKVQYLQYQRIYPCQKGKLL